MLPLEEDLRETSEAKRKAGETLAKLLMSGARSLSRQTEELSSRTTPVELMRGKAYTRIVPSELSRLRESKRREEGVVTGTKTVKKERHVSLLRS